MSDIRVGTCGYRYYNPGENWEEQYESKVAAYSDAYDVGEINSTFYSLPQVSTTERWRREAQADFEFTLKAWQAMTHSWSSPTWNGNRDDAPAGDTDEIGHLQPTTPVRTAWEETRARAEALEASVVVVQTPPGFDCTDEHEADMRELVSSIDRGGLDVAWEPRGDWPDNPDRIRALCADLELIHVVDLMRSEPVGPHDRAYTRLHGLNEDPYDYDYDYSDAEIDDLAATLRDLADARDRVYALFNNYEMFPNAAELLTTLTD